MRKYVKAVVNIVIAFAAVLFTILLFRRFLLLFTPFIIGWIIALIASPLVHFFEHKLKIKRKAGSAFVIIVVITLVVLVIYLVISKISDEASRLISSLPSIWLSLEGEFDKIGGNLSVLYNRLSFDYQNSISDFLVQIGDYLGNLVSRIGTPTIMAVGNIAKRLPNIIISIIMTLMSAYFFVSDRDKINSWFAVHTPESIKTQYGIIRKSFVKAVGGYFEAQLKIELWIYLLLVTGFVIIGVDYALLVALIIAFFDFLPFLGTGTVMVPWAILKILSADYQTAIGLLIIWGVGQLVRQIIQPKIVGESVGMPPLPTLILLYVGYKTASVIGMIVAVPLGLILMTMYEEGAFDTFKNSVRILVTGINNFRKIEDEDLKK